MPNQIDYKYQFVFSKNHFTLFSRLKMFFFFSLFQTIKLNLKWPTTLQQPWKNWLAPTRWTLVNVKTDSDEFLGPKILSTTCTWNSKCSRGMKTNNLDWHKNWQWETQTLIKFIRLRNQLVVAVREFSRGKSTTRASETTSKRHGGAAQTYTSCRSCWSTTQEELRDYAALQYGEARDFICSSAIVWKKKGRRKIHSNCLCEQ